MDSELWASHELHIFVMSNSGKPIYARYGNENNLATLFGVMQVCVCVCVTAIGLIVRVRVESHFDTVDSPKTKY